MIVDYLVNGLSVAVALVGEHGAQMGHIGARQKLLYIGTVEQRFFLCAQECSEQAPWNFQTTAGIFSMKNGTASKIHNPRAHA
jgi:hypothetical protein